MLGTPYQTKLTFLANLLTILRILLQWKLDYDNDPSYYEYIKNPDWTVSFHPDPEDDDDE